MKHKLLSALGLIVLGMVTLGVIPAEAASAAGPYYATPSWDQKLQCDTLATCPRFIVLSNWNNEAVLDRETGLVWEKSPSTSTMAWAATQSYCNNLTVGNRKGWRRPTIEELASLVDPMQSSPALPAGHPFISVQSGALVVYWSATTFASSSGFAGGVNFALGEVSFTTTGNNGFVWCVRGGQGVGPQ